MQSAFDLTEPCVDQSWSQKVDQTKAHGKDGEALSTNLPKPHGNSVLVSCFAHVDHACNCVTQRLNAGILIFVNLFHFKWWNMFVTATFGSELVAVLQMFGTPIKGPANVHCGNNLGVMKSTSLRGLTLSKKWNAANHHAFQEVCVAGIVKVSEEPTHLVRSSFGLALFGDLLCERNGWLGRGGSTRRMVPRPEFPFLLWEWAPPWLVLDIGCIELAPRHWSFHAFAHCAICALTLLKQWDSLIPHKG